MPPIHVAGEMAVWNEDKWAAFEGELQRQMRAERRRLDRLARERRRGATVPQQALAWTLFAATMALVLLY